MFSFRYPLLSPLNSPLLYPPSFHALLAQLSAHHRQDEDAQQEGVSHSGSESEEEPQTTQPQEQLPHPTDLRTTPNSSSDPGSSNCANNNNSNANANTNNNHNNNTNNYNNNSGHSGNDSRNMNNHTSDSSPINIIKENRRKDSNPQKHSSDLHEDPNRHRYKALETLQALEQQRLHENRALEVFKRFESQLAPNSHAMEALRAIEMKRNQEALAREAMNKSKQNDLNLLNSFRNLNNQKLQENNNPVENYKPMDLNTLEDYRRALEARTAEARNQQLALYSARALQQQALSSNSGVRDLNNRRSEDEEDVSRYLSPTSSCSGSPTRGGQTPPESPVGNEAPDDYSLKKPPHSQSTPTHTI